MKLPKHKQIDHKCDDCGNLKKKIDMYNQEFCYNCWDEQTAKDASDEEK